MGQINIARISDISEVIIPPADVDGIYNDGGEFYIINSSNEISALGGGIKQIAVTVSHAEVLDLYNTKKVLIPAGGNGIVNQIVNAYVLYNYLGGGGYSTNTTLAIYQSSQNYTLQADMLAATASGRYMFYQGGVGLGAAIPTLEVSGTVSLSTVSGNPTGGSASLTIYLTYQQWNENIL